MCEITLKWCSKLYKNALNIHKIIYFPLKNKTDTVGYVVNSQAEIIPKSSLKSSFRLKLDSIFLEHANVLQFCFIDDPYFCSCSECKMS